MNENNIDFIEKKLKSLLNVRRINGSVFKKHERTKISCECMNSKVKEINHPQL